MEMIDGGRKVSLRKIGNVAGIEYAKWIFNPRMIIFVVLCIFLYDYVMEAMLNGVVKAGGYIMVLEPFIAMANSELLIMVLPAVFLVLMSDFPKTDGNTMFYIQRTGKFNWIFGQIVFGIMAAATYLSGIFLVSVVTVVHKAYAKNMWSPLVTSYAKMFPNERESRIPMLINGRMFNNMTPVQAFILTFTLLLVYLIVMEMLLLVGFAAGKRMIGMIVCYTVIGVGSSLCGMGNDIQWAFPAAHSLAWLHFDYVLKVQSVDIRYSYLYFIILFIVLSVVSVVSIRRYDFSKITDMED